MKTSLKFFNQFCNKQNGRQRKTVMRLQVLIFFLFLFVSVRAQRDFEFSYSQNSFTVNDTQGLLQINSNLPDYRRAGDLTCPNFQYFPLRVLLPAGWDELNYEVEFDKRLLRTGERRVSQKVDGTTYQLNTLDWSPGVYVVRATNEGQGC